MKSLYDILMIPLEKSGIKEARKELLSIVEGNVLEVGAGTGVNSSFYDYSNISLTVTDTSLNKHLKKRFYNKATINVCSVESLPFEDQSFNYVIHTLVFCSVKNVGNGLSEIRRVLRDDGKLLFIEHVIPKRNPLRRVFKLFTPFWKHIASNCHLDRDFINALVQSGFEVETLREFNKEIFVYGVAVKGAKGLAKTL